MKVFLILFVFIVSFLAFDCRSPGRIKRRPNHGKTTEFHREPVKFIPLFYGNYNTRGQDISASSGKGHVTTLNKMGGGVGLFVNSALSDQWVGHRLFYYYADIDVSPEYSGNPYPGSKKWIVSSYPGLYLRSYLPFWIKYYVGMGGVLRFNNTPYDRWGLYAQAGLELYGVTASSIFIAHPSQGNLETEYRLGYMWTPISR